MLQEDASNRSSSFDSYRERITNFSNEFDLGLFIYIVKRSLIWIALCLGLALAAAYIYLRYTAPTYESRSVIQLSQTNNAQKVLKMNDLVEDDNLRADVELLRSKFFIERMLRRLPLEISYYFKGQVLTTEYYTATFFRLTDVVVKDEDLRGKPISCTQKGPDGVTLSYAIGKEQFSFEQPMDGPFVTPHFTARVELEKGNTFQRDEDGTVFFVI
ncbi:MAG TPA: Wzz/FepE/Etk N-terminal domain-containing protein, partial [Flavobacteriales bacterium]